MQAIEPETPGTHGASAAPPVARRLPARAVLLVVVPVVCDAAAVLAVVMSRVAAPAALIAAAVVAAAVLLLPPTPGRLLHGLGPTGRAVLPRTALALVAAFQRPSSAVWIAVALVCVALQLEPVAARLAKAAVPVAANLPGFRIRNTGPLDRDRLFVIDTAALAVVAVIAAAGPAPTLLLVVALTVAGGAVLIAAVVCVDAGLRIRARKAADPSLAEALAAYAPRFVLHWDATAGTEYQVAMWLPQLERAGLPFAIVVRNPGTFAGIAAMTDAPVLVRRDPADLDVVVVPSLTAAFYVNNAARNTHLVRFTHLEHVQLGHGDSDKAPSWSPVHRLYTRVFVSGRAAVDRFARNGVRVPDDLLTVVGRPQVAGMLVGGATSKVPTALYAPTWAGANADSNHSSLPVGVEVVSTLLEQGYRVFYRPHPYTDRDADLAEQSRRIDVLLARDAQRSGRVHLDSARTAGLDLHACFDAAHLLVSDVSSVASDWLQSEKPLVLMSMAEEPDVLAQESSIAAGAYLVPADGAGVREAVAAASGPDPLLGVRRSVKAHVLGDHGGADPVEVFSQHVRRAVLGDGLRATAG